jgi:nitrogen fixation protein NifB
MILQSSFQHLVKRHPCLSPESHGKFGRIHLPVSPSCNIQCRFCRRCFNKYEDRPGVSRGILTPAEAVDTVGRALELCPQITVVGIAGPGDTLATDHALETFELVDRKYPQLIKCLSTNGLELLHKAERVIDAGVRTITVTINAVDPAILEKICAGIVYLGSHLTGRDAAEILITAQLAGISRIVELGSLVKVNMVLVPGVNDQHVEAVAKTVTNAGATMINLIPLIPQFEFENLEPPSCSELHAAREVAEKYLQVFRHCKHCRADACGIPGSGVDLADKLYDRQMETFSHG